MTHMLLLQAPLSDCGIQAQYWTANFPCARARLSYDAGRVIERTIFPSFQMTNAPYGNMMIGWLEDLSQMQMKEQSDLKGK